MDEREIYKAACFGGVAGGILGVLIAMLIMGLAAGN